MEVNKKTPQEVLPRIRAILEEGGSCRLLVTGSSMLPFLRSERDWVILSPCTGAPKRGDILFYVRPGEKCILHRVHRVLDEDRYLICGDAQSGLEEVSQSQIVAEVSHVLRGEKLISCKSWGWRLLSRLWMTFKPVRPGLMRLIGLAWRIRQKWFTRN